MTLPTNDDVAKRELATSELEAISGGLRERPNPPMGGAGGGCHGPHHHPPYLPPIHYYPLRERVF